MLNNMKISFKLIALVAVVLAASILLVMALGSDDSGILKSIFLQSENSILFIIIAISVPVLLIALLLVLALVKPSSEPVTIKVGEITAENATAAESTEERGERFCMLSDIERRKETFRRAKYDESVTLESLCENLRNFAASRLRLYYDISDI
ncbi:MAG: hypothetical protein IKC55_03645, partial [Clostridia bacterium]|nr:hypothetical protein [Clostridia bacterium]